MFFTRLFFQFINWLKGEKAGDFIRGLGVLMADKPSWKDFRVAFLGWGDDYIPKQDRVLLSTISTKNQYNRNTCTFESAVVQKESQEGIKLSVRKLVSYAFKKGYIKGNGFSTLKNSQQCLIDFGSEPEGDENNYPWHQYVQSLNSVEQMEAKAYRSHSFWKLETMAELYRALDEGNIVQVAATWYTGYNMTGGLHAPWILPYRAGYKVGGHAFVAIGYDTDYHGQEVIIFQNSFGEGWGDQGKFYMRAVDFKKELSVFGGMVTIDMEVDVGKFIRDYTGMAVKIDGQPEIYLIENGTRVHIQTMEELSDRGISSWETLPNSLSNTLLKVPEGNV